MEGASGCASSLLCLSCTTKRMDWIPRKTATGKSGRNTGGRSALIFSVTHFDYAGQGEGWQGLLNRGTVVC